MPIKKMAIFVEGQTEVIFLKRLLEELAGEKSLHVHETTQIRDLRTLEISLNRSVKYFVLIVNCRCDAAVKSSILDNRPNLIKNGYDLALGLRDLYPIGRDKLAEVSRRLRTGVPTKELHVQICLAVMETEAWFLQENKHYIKIDPTLTTEKIIAGVGFNPEEDNAESVRHPAEMLGKIYQLAGKGYKKSRRQVERTVNALDYANLYLNSRRKLKYFDRFLGHLEAFIQ